jgi:hypothetical protein
MVPLVDNPSFTTELRIMVDSQEIARRTVGLGDFEVRAPAPAGPGRHRVDLRFSAVQQLPAPDGRQVAARVHFVGFQAESESTQAGSESAVPP